MKKSIGLVAALLIMGFSLVGLLGCITSSSNGERGSGITSLELAVLMGNGINLSNTMEAYGHLSHGLNRDPRTYETLWGQPLTTQAMFTAMKKSGFDSIRIRP